MNNSNLFHFELNIDYELYIFLDIEKLDGDVNPMYREKNSLKKNHELSYVGLMQSEKHIILRHGLMTHVFLIRSGNTEKLEGEYEIEYFGKGGRITIEEIKEERD